MHLSKIKNNFLHIKTTP